MRQAAALALALVVAAVPWVLWWSERRQRAAEVAALRAELESTVSRAVRDAAQRAPQQITVQVPSAGPAQVRVERVEVPVPVLGPGGEIRVVEVPRIVTVTEPVPCRTVDECRRIFAAAPQAITVEAAIPAGTVVPVRVQVEGHGEQEARAPLADDLPIRLHLVQSERGVWHALDVPGATARPTSVRVESSEPAPGRQEDPGGVPAPQDHLRVVAGLDSAGAIRAAVEYENTWGAGRYRLQVGIQAGPTGGWWAAAWYVVPLR